MAILYATYFASLVVALVISSVTADCKFSAHDLPKTHNAPLILHPLSSNDEYIHFQLSYQGDITVPQNGRIIFACPGTGNRVSNDRNRRQYIDAVCNNNRLSDVPDPVNLLCAKNYTAKAVQMRKGCGHGGRVVNVRHELLELNTRSFVSSYSLCFEGNLLTPRYAWQDMSRTVGSLRMGPRPFFTRGGYGMDLTRDYKLSTTYLNRYLRTDIYTRGNNLTKGHIVPRADFPYAALQDATFLYENSAPQWATVNNGNWRLIETAVRRLAEYRRNLTVTTGTWGTAQLRDLNRILLRLFLNGNERVPVPALFFKVLYDPETREGVAIFTSNNPYFSFSAVDVPPVCPRSNPQLCRSLMDWLRIIPNNLQLGEVKCCEIGNVNSQLQITELPTDVSGLLTHKVGRRARVRVFQ